MDPRRTFRRRVAALTASILLILAAIACGQERVVAIGDIHGAYPEFVSILQQTGLIDTNRKWTGGSATLVQTGDVMDRGARTRECLDLLMQIERQASKPRGKVIPLLGNHEVLNMLGDVRYATAEIFRTFADSQSQKKREKAYRDYLKFHSAHRTHGHAASPIDEDAARDKWMDAHPLGYFEYRDALGTKGKYGAWIRKHRAAVKVGDGLFVHGGLNPALQFRNVEELNTQIRSELAAFDVIRESLVRQNIIWRYMTLEEAVRYVDEELRWIQAGQGAADPETARQMQLLLGINKWMISNMEGPLWYRGLAQEQEEKLSAAVQEMLERLKARYIAVGHTVISRSGITPRFDNRVFLIDVGMLRAAYGGRAAALEIFEGQITACYPDGERTVLVPRVTPVEQPKRR